MLSSPVHFPAATGVYQFRVLRALRGLRVISQFRALRVSMPFRALRVTLPLLTLSLLSSCSLLGLDPRSDKERELARNRRLWDSRAINEYHYVMRRLCFCAPESTSPQVITVHGGVITSVVYASNGAPVPAFIASTALSVTGLFDIIQQAIDRDAYQLSVQYDAALGFPTSIAIDYILNAADDEVTYTAGSFQSLPDARR